MPRLNVLSENSDVEDSMIDTCVTCPKLCRWACPVAEAEARETTTPWNLVNMSAYVKRGLMRVEDFGDLPFHCSHCGACTSACLHDNDVAGLMTMARARLLEAGVTPARVLEVQGHFGIAGNPYGESLAAPLQKIVEDLGLENDGHPDDTRVLYQPGCATIYEHPDSVNAFIRVLNVHGIGELSIDDESSKCCGLPLLWAGDLDGFRSHAQRHAARLEGRSTVVVQDPACAHAMRVRYPDVGVRISAEILHVTEFLSVRIENVVKRMPKSEAQTVAYSDCCSLSYGLNLGEDPRELIAKLAQGKLVSLPLLTGNAQDCCGAAGLLPLTSPATAEAMASTRLLSFRESGAQQLVTFSPRCAAHLKSIAPNENIVDAMELLASI